MRSIVCTLVLAATLLAQDRAIVLRGARLFDGRSDRLVSPGAVVVVGNKIQAAGTRADAPAGAETIDLGDVTLLPGFIDAHTHLSHNCHADFRDRFIDRERKTIPEMTLDALENLHRTLQ